MKLKWKEGNFFALNLDKIVNKDEFLQKIENYENLLKNVKFQLFLVINKEM